MMPAFLHKPRIRHQLSLRRELWLRALLFALMALILAATFLAYFSPDALMDFAKLRLC